MLNYVSKTIRLIYFDISLDKWLFQLKKNNFYNKIIYKIYQNQNIVKNKVIIEITGCRKININIFLFVN